MQIDKSPSKPRSLNFLHPAALYTQYRDEPMPEGGMKSIGGPKLAKIVKGICNRCGGALRITLTHGKLNIYCLSCGDIGGLK